jgi:hypothetical protein
VFLAEMTGERIEIHIGRTLIWRSPCSDAFGQTNRSRS